MRLRRALNASKSPLLMRRALSRLIAYRSLINIVLNSTVLPKRAILPLASLKKVSTNKQLLSLK
jgi:hypothetical protein